MPTLFLSPLSRQPDLFVIIHKIVGLGLCWPRMALSGLFWSFASALVLLCLFGGWLLSVCKLSRSLSPVDFVVGCDTDQGEVGWHQLGVSRDMFMSVTLSEKFVETIIAVFII